MSNREGIASPHHPHHHISPPPPPCLVQEHAFEGPAGGVFTGTVLEETTVGDEGSQVPAVVVLVAGEAFYTGRATFFAEKRDALGSGFLLE